MRKYTAVSLLVVFVVTTALFATGCGKDREKVLSGFNEIMTFDAIESAEEGYEKLSEVEAYLDENLKYVEAEDADYMLFQYLEEAYKIDTEYVSYREVSDEYSQYLSDILNKLLEVEILDEESPLTNESEGGKLNHEWDEIATRALMMENLVIEHKEEINSPVYAYMKEHVLWHYKYYINLMLIGTSSNPLFSYETGEFDENASAIYVSVAQENSTTTVGWALNEYFTYLDSTRYQLNYRNPEESKVYYDTCNYIVTEAGKRVFQ